MLTCNSHLPRDSKQAVMENLMRWVYALVKAKNLYSFDRGVGDVALLTLFDVYAPHVEKRLLDLSSPTDKGIII